MTKEDIQEYLGCNGFEALTHVDGNKYYDEKTVISIALEVVKNCSTPVVMPSLEDARIAKEKYMKKKKASGYNTYLTGVGNHFQDGFNCALNKIKKLN